VRILIDTHYVLWSALAPGRIAPGARKLLVISRTRYQYQQHPCINQPQGAKGKLPEAAKFESDLIVSIEDRLGFVLMPLEPESMMRAARFYDEHADPFDRMIAA
jgi:PIN domain nuclease of toxin-antitoxin system